MHIVSTEFNTLYSYNMYLSYNLFGTNITENLKLHIYASYAIFIKHKEETWQCIVNIERSF